MTWNLKPGYMKRSHHPLPAEIPYGDLRTWYSRALVVVVPTATSCFPDCFHLLMKEAASSGTS